MVSSATAEGHGVYVVGDQTLTPGQIRAIWDLLFGIVAYVDEDGVDIERVCCFNND